MKTKVKKYAVLAGLCAVCVLIIAMIGVKFYVKMPEFEPEPAQEVSKAIPPPKINQISDSVVNTDEEMIDETEETPEVVINPQLQTEETQEVTSVTEQTIQPDVTKPEPSESQLTDSTQTPDGEIVENNIFEEPENADNKPLDAVSQTTNATTKEPQGGDIQNGKIYIPGFGWVDNHGGGGQAIQADDMYENGNKIGIMG